MKTLFITVILAVVLIGIAIVALGIKVLFVKGGRFPSGHAHDLPELRRRGIGCAHGGADRKQKR
ncbi:MULTISPECIES: hypothetical protein [Duncaniella]|jgi:hypothetical protein|uniref:hypothetical protein n=1 Tax=Duncaniella TaxID=2518495 RepID=UPI00136A9051|nr:MULTISPECIES: hypothetical protein [Duncaniella]